MYPYYKFEVSFLFLVCHEKRKTNVPSKPRTPKFEHHWSKGFIWCAMKAA